LRRGRRRRGIGGVRGNIRAQDAFFIVGGDGVFDDAAVVLVDDGGVFGSHHCVLLLW